jgi:DNA-binding transcriptional LysR family regulator
MDSIDGLKTVVAVVETGSFTAAGERLNMSKALVSKYVGEVEKQLNVRLFYRTTRQLAITDAGKNYYENALALLEQYSSMLDSVTGEQTSPKGTLRISAPVTFGEIKLSPLIPKFMEQYPELKVEIILTNNAVDMLEEGIDIRLRIGGVDDSTMIARHLKSFPLILCVSPSYLESHGEPKIPQEISEHKTIIDSNFRIGTQWPFISSKGSSEVVKVNSSIAINSPKAVEQLAIAGGGIGLIPEFIVEDSIASGKLTKILSNYATLEFGLHAIYPHRKYVPKKVRCFIDFMLKEFSS